MFSVEVTNYERLLDSLHRLDNMEGNVLEPGTREWLQMVRARLKGRPYPPKTPIQTYVRTGNLANRWAVSGLSITNAADYSEWVVGDDQAEVHKGRWWMARTVVEEATEDLATVLVKGIEDQWR